MSTPKMFELRTAEGIFLPAINPGHQPVKSMLEMLENIAENGLLGMISVDWLGCFACNLGSPYVRSVEALAEAHSSTMSSGRVLWRGEVLDQTDGFNNPVTWSYQLFHEMTRSGRQWFGGNRPVETFTNRDEYFRPKFPQLFFLDGSKIDRDHLHTIRQFEARSDLFYRAADLRIGHKPPGNLENAINAVFPDASILLQLTNYNLYRDANDQDFHQGSFDQSAAQLLEAFAVPDRPAADCIVYDRRTAVPQPV